MRDPHLTLIGNVVDAPKRWSTKTGNDMTSFRLASTSSRYDQQTGAWVDNTTLFVNVVCWRALAVNVDEALQKGDPVVVTGRYQARTYVKEEVTRTTYEIIADSVGHDLTRGVSKFQKVRRSAAATFMELGADGLPADAMEQHDDVLSADFAAERELAHATDRELAHAS
ncbi:single-strand DNA-binding protein [Jatrophihabitans sp. GAS493]|uniref:single-stranded DNA-binding protein n=1 Tax=Jatrophihabitans sp. GAS493 TaxID=1907575 RepID=UPI000BC0D8A8|nr:single-stranded DNA-binding protein [Jatrophihabitans sp. GAS493]SOD72833.1 single-strand DNA-binding protein [Jatrophihabitans sp. GAS493]